MKKTIILNIFLVLLFIFSILIIIFSIQNTNYFYERYSLYKNYVNYYDDIIDVSEDAIQSINETTNVYYGYFLKNIFSIIFASVCATFSIIILFLIKPNIFDCIKNSQSLEKRKSERLARKAEREENAKQQRIAKLQSELDELKKGE